MDIAAIDALIPLDMHIYNYTETAGNDLTGIKVILYDRPMLNPTGEHNRGCTIRKIERLLHRGFVLANLKTEDGEIHKNRYAPPLKKRTITFIFEDRRNKRELSEILKYVATTVTTENRVHYHSRDEECD